MKSYMEDEGVEFYGEAGLRRLFWWDAYKKMV